MRQVTRFILALMLTALSGQVVVGQSATEVLDKAWMLYRDGQAQKSIDLLKDKEFAGEDRATAEYYMGRAWFNLENLDKAEEHIARANVLNPQNAVYRFWLGRVYGSKAQKANVFRKPFLAKKTKAAFEEAAELDPNYIDARYGLLNYYQQAPGIMGGSDAKAKEQAEAIANIDAYEGYLAWAEYHQNREEYEKMEGKLAEAIEAYPDSLSARYQMGYRMMNTGKFVESAAMFEQIIAIDSDQWSALYQIGKAAAESGENLDRGEEAVSIFLDSLDVDATVNRSWAHYRLGQIQANRGNTAAARAEFDKALLLNKDHKEAKKALKKLGRS